MKCGACGRDNVAGARYCAFCGQALEVPARTPADAAPLADSIPPVDARPIRENPLLPPRRPVEAPPPYPGRQAYAPAPDAGRAGRSQPAPAADPADEAVDVPVGATRRARRMAAARQDEDEPVASNARQAQAGPTGGGQPRVAGAHADPPQASRPNEPSATAPGDGFARANPTPSAQRHPRVDLGPYDDPTGPYAAPAHSRGPERRAAGAPQPGDPEPDEGDWADAHGDSGAHAGDTADRPGAQRHAAQDGAHVRAPRADSHASGPASDAGMDVLRAQGSARDGEKSRPHFHVAAGTKRADPRSGEAAPAADPKRGNPRSGEVAPGRSADGSPVRRSMPAREPVPSASGQRRLPSPAKPPIAPPKGKMFLFDDEKGATGPEYDDEDDFDEERRPSRFKAILAGALALILMFMVLFFLYSSTGRRIRASMGISSSADDHMILASWYASQGDAASAERAYNDVLRIDMDNYQLCLRVAQGFEDIQAYDRAEKLYVYMIQQLAPGEDEPYDRLIALLDLEGKTELSAQWDAYRQSVREAEAAAAGLYAPQPDLPAGAYGKEIAVTLTGTSGAEIRYTLDGSRPGANSNRYTGPISIGSGNHELRAVTVRDGDVSAEYRGTYFVSPLKAPSFNPPSGSYAPDHDGALIVTLSGDDPFTIHYTLDGSDPTDRSAIYDGALMLGKGTTTLRAVCVDSAGNLGAIASATYVVQG